MPHPSRHRFAPDHATVSDRPRQGDFDLVIGIPSVSRTPDYVMQTVRLLLSRMGPCAPLRIGIVVLDVDRPTRPERMARLLAAHEAEAETGQLRCVSLTEVTTDPGVDRYDAVEHRWRVRQVLDAASLMDVCAPLAPYYLHLEDDVEPAHQYGVVLRDAINRFGREGETHAMSFYSPLPVEQGVPIDLSAYRGFIGVLLPTTLLGPMSDELRRRAEERPVDHLVAAIMAERGWIMRAHAPSLFEHVGFVSSLPLRIQSEHAWSWSGDRTRTAAFVRRVTRSVRVRLRRWQVALDPTSVWRRPQP